MSSCFGIGHSHIADTVDREAVIETAVVAQNTAMAVRGIFAEADVGNDEEGREASAQKAD